MSIRDRLVEDLTSHLMSEAGFDFHFSHGEPVVTRISGGRVKSQHYVDIRAQAEAIYELFLNRIDFNRLTFEMGRAYVGLGGDLEQVYDLTREPGILGAALRLALETHETYPDYKQAANLTKENDRG